MKKNLIYALISCCILSFTACNDSIEDASSKHVYGENENPYLKVKAGAVITNDLEFAVGHFEAQTVKLSDFADQFKTNMNMTVEQVISGLKDGTVVFYNISTSKGAWDKSAMTKGTTGWYYNSAGGVCTATDASQTVSLDFDPNAKTLIVIPNNSAKAGTVLTFNVGFAVKGADYDNYVRFTFNVSITDPSIILTNITIPEGDYNSFGIDFKQYASVIQKCMGLTVDEFFANLDANAGKNIHMYSIDSNGTWDSTSAYTANPPGYWMTGTGTVCNWNATGFTFYAETNPDDKMLYVGRAPNIAAGSKYTISVGYKDTKNEKNFFRFIITATLK